MDSAIGDIGSGGIRLTLESVAADAALRPGQRIVARVLEILPDIGVLLEIGLSRAEVRMSGPVALGDRVVLEVVTGAPAPEFRIVTDAAAAAPQAAAAQSPGIGAQRVPPALSARDLPAIMQALADIRTTGVPIAEAGQAFLRAAVAADLRPAVLVQIQRLLAPLEAALPLPALAATIRTFLAQSGLFTENHLGDALNNGARTLDPQQVVPDLRLLLGQLATATVVPEAVRSFGDALLQQQLTVAEGLAGAGVGQVVIPFMFGDNRANVVFEWGRDAPEKENQDQPDRAMSLGVFVHLKSLGAIEARVQWRPESLAVTFFVERESTRALVEAGLCDFSKQLELSGCAQVTSSVWFNPARVSSPPSPVTPSRHGGTILDVMA